MPKLPLSETLPELLATAKFQLRHDDYDYVTTMAKDYTMYLTGVGIKDKLKRFNGGETEQMFQQREILTMTNVADIVNSCVKPLNKASRTPATILMNWTGKDAKEQNTNREKVNEAQKSFWGKRNVKDYLTSRVGLTDSQDPNSFLVIEFKEKIDPKNPTKEKPKPYPFEVNSTEAVNYIYKNNELQWLIVRKEIVLTYDGKNTTGEKLYFYKDTHNVVATEIHKESIESFKQSVPFVLLSDVANYDQLKPEVNYIFVTDEDEAKSRYYVINVFEHNLPFVPAIRFGTLTDPIRRHRVCMPVISPAKSYFEDSIQTMSEFSITKRLHTFPQKWQYLPKCDAPGCFKGKSKDGVTDCVVCKGTGTITHASSQDIVGIRMPDELKDIVNLDLMATYKGPPIDLVKFQKEFGFEDLRRYAQSAVYNNEVGRRRVKTATESEIDSEAVNDTLKPYADNFSAIYEFVFTCIAHLIDLGENFNIVHQFPDDLQIQTMTEILDDLKKANETGASSHIKKALQSKLTRKIYVDQPAEILKFDTKNKYYPFPGKTETEIQFILANGKTTKYASTLYCHFDLIFSDLEFDSRQLNPPVDFYQMDEKIQRDKLEKKVAEYIAKIETESSTDVSNEFGASGSDIQIPTDLEAESKAKLKGSVGGVQGILEVQASVGQGTTTYEAGVATLIEIYGFDEEKAKRILGKPKAITEPAPIK